MLKTIPVEIDQTGHIGQVNFSSRSHAPAWECILPCIVATYGFPRRPWEPETFDSDFEKLRPYTSLEIERLA